MHLPKPLRWLTGGWILVATLRLTSIGSTLGFIICLVWVIFAADRSALLIALICAVLAAISAAAEIVIGGRRARTLESAWRHQLLDATYMRRTARHTRGYLASIVNLMTDNVERAGEYRGTYIGATVAAVSAPFLIGVVVGIAYDWATGAVIVLLYACVPVLVGAFQHAFRRVSSQSRRQRLRLTARYTDALRHLTTIRLLGAGPRTESELKEAGEHNRRAIMNLLAVNQLVIIVLNGAFLLVLVVCTVAMVIYRYRSGVLDSLQAITVVALTSVLLEPLTQVAGFFYVAMGGRAAQRAINRFLKTAATPGGAPHPAASEAIPSSRSVAPTEIAVELDRVSFTYDAQPVLERLSLRVPQGQRLALVGPSGSGKSTLLDLIGGRLEPTCGTVLVNSNLVDSGEPGTAPAPHRSQLSATVSQRTRLFAQTIAYNLKFANPHATTAELWQALEGAHLAAEVAAMPRGLDTLVGEGGAFLSGGQAQRLSLARALLSGRKLLLLDEPTAHVDPESEQAMMAAITQLGRDYTVIMATHRHAAAEWFDATVRLDALAGEGQNR